MSRYSLTLTDGPDKSALTPTHPQTPPSVRPGTPITIDIDGKQIQAPVSYQAAVGKSCDKKH